MLSAHPELTPDDVREALLATADRADNPDNDYGWGIINAYEAILYHGTVFSNAPEMEVVNNQLEVSVMAASPAGIPGDGMSLFYAADGSGFSEMQMSQGLQDDQWVATIPEPVGSDTVFFYFSAIDQDNRTAFQPYNAPELVFSYPEGAEVYSPRHSFIPDSYVLYQNRPNPFNPTTTIEFDLPRPGAVTLNVYNVFGQKVRVLVDNQNLAARRHTIRWNGEDQNGNPVASGVYFYMLQRATGNETKRMLLLR